MPKSFTGPAVLATGFVIVSCAFGQETHLKTSTIQVPAQTTATIPALRQSGSNPELSGSDTWTICDAPVTTTAFDSNDHTASQPAGSALRSPISISIASPTSAVLNATGSTINVSGTATGGAGITQVTWQTSNGATGVATGDASWVASGIPVLQGTTTIIMRAYDSKGSSNWVAFVAVHL